MVESREIWLRQMTLEKVVKNEEIWDKVGRTDVQLDYHQSQYQLSKERLGTVMYNYIVERTGGFDGVSGGL